MSSRRDNTEVRRQQTASHHYLSSNLLESTQMYDNESTAIGASGCSRFRSVNPHVVRQQLSSKSTINVMPIRVSSTLHNLDTQANNSRSPDDSRSANRHCKLNETSLAARLWAISSCFLVALMLATNPGQCAPTTKIVSHRPVVVVASSLANLHNNNNNNNNNNGPSPHSQEMNQQQQTQSGVVDVQPIIIVNPAHHEPGKQHESSSGSVVAPAAHSKVDKLATAAAADDESSIEDETILLVLAGESSPSSIRRLMKRSGISDQRLAEIQMIRALKKQMERAATKIAAESGGNGASSGNAGGDVK